MLLENIRRSYGLAKRVCLFCLLPILPLSCAEGEVDMLGVNLVKGADGWQRGFCDASVTDEHIYLLYNDAGTSFVLVYDWDGEPVKAYSFEEEVINIFVEPSGTKLYTLSADEDSNCDLNIYPQN